MQEKHAYKIRHMCTYILPGRTYEIEVLLNTNRSFAIPDAPRLPNTAAAGTVWGRLMLMRPVPLMSIPTASAAPDGMGPADT